MDGRELIEHCRHICEVLGVSHYTDLSRLSLTGKDPVLASPHKLGSAASIAAGVHGSIIAAIWCSRGGRPQTVTTDIETAVRSLNSSAFLTQGGRSIGMGVGYHEPLNRFYEANDRWFRFVGSRPRHRDAILSALQCANDPKAIQAAVNKSSAFELEDLCAYLGVPGGAVRSSAEWRAHPQGRSLLTLPVVELRKVGDSDPEPFGVGTRPLSDVRVLDSTHVLAGPSSTRTLAAHGAHVLRITPPSPGQDPLYMAMDTGFGKRNAYLNLKAAEDNAKAFQLLAGADVFAQSYRYGSLDKYGLGMEEAISRRPGLIYLSVSCYGEGPWEDRPGFDPNAATVTGIAHDEAIGGVPSLPPTTLLSDYLTGYLAASGIAAALLRRSVEGGSYHVKVSLARTAMWVQDLGLLQPEEYAGRPRTLDRNTPLLHMETPFGQIGYVAPIPQYGETPAYWDSPPRPLGESPAEWHH